MSEKADRQASVFLDNMKSFATENGASVAFFPLVSRSISFFFAYVYVRCGLVLRATITASNASCCCISLCMGRFSHTFVVRVTPCSLTGVRDGLALLPRWRENRRHRFPALNKGSDLGERLGLPNARYSSGTVAHIVCGSDSGSSK